MFCKKCGHALYDDCNFCHNCGEKLSEKPKEESEQEPESSDATLLFAILILIAIGFYFLYVTGHIQ